VDVPALWRAGDGFAFAAEAFSFSGQRLIFSFFGACHPLAETFFTPDVQFLTWARPWADLEPARSPNW
jgi:hypothetical protein